LRLGGWWLFFQIESFYMMTIHTRDTVAEDSKLLRRRIEAVVEAGGYFFK
jgi:hypothetical protein